VIALPNQDFVAFTGDRAGRIADKSKVAEVGIAQQLVE
jgi:hypothetical protein